MSSRTKERIIHRHQENPFLTLATPSLVRRSSNDLSVDQPSKSIDRPLVDRAVQALHEGQTHYVDVPGIGQLRDALAEHLNGRWETEYEQADILVTAGIQESRFLTLQKIGELFDTIAVPAVTHPGVCRALGTRSMDVHAVPVDREGGFLPTLAGIREAFETGCRLVYLESPSRLTGAVYNATAVEGIAALLQEFDAAAIWDQGLAEWVPRLEYTSLASQENIANQLALIGEAWPGMGLENWLIGYIAVNNQEWFEPMRSQKQIMAICTSTPSQYAALAASQHYEETHQTQLEQLTRSRDRSVEAARKAGIDPIQGGAVNVIALPRSADGGVDAMLLDMGIAFADGDAFGASDTVRLAVTLDNSTEQVLTKFSRDD